MMETSRAVGKPWRLWTGIALVLVALALAQACGQSGSRTGPTSDAKLELKLRRVGGAELQAGCTGTYSVSGPGVNIQNAPLPADGQISFQGQVGQTYTVSVQVTCKSGCVQSGSVTFTLQQGPNKAEIVLTCSKVLGLACQSPVAPNQVSHCTCSVQSAGSVNIAWQGATPTGGNTADFSSPTPGSFPVTCTINGVDSLTTNVVVETGDGSIRIFNDALALRRKSFASHLPYSSIFARVVGVPNTTREIEAGHSTAVSAPPGSQQVEASCNSSFDESLTKSAQVTAGQETDVHFDIFEEFQNCD
jgi:hypothetical protein